MKGGGSGGSSDHGDAGASKNPSSNMSMFEAAKTGDSERVQALIMDGVDVNKTDEAGERCVCAYTYAWSAIHLYFLLCPPGTLYYCSTVQRL